MAHESSGIHPGGAWGHLTLRRDLGPGARGLVYRAWDPELGAEVVLAIGPDVQTDPAGRDILREARLLAKVRTTRQVIRDRNGHVVVVPFGAGRDALGAAVASLSLPLGEPLAPGAEPNSLTAGARVWRATSSASARCCIGS